MKIFLAAAALGTAANFAYADIGVSVNIGQPGFYGRLDIGNYPPPVLIYPEPVVIQRVPPGITYQPLYLRVPPGHARNWGRYCHRYGACGRPVYFVQDTWYNDVYVPRHRELHGERAYRYDDRRRFDGDGRSDRRYAPSYPPEHRPGNVPRGGPDYPPGPRPGPGGPGYGPVYGPGFSPGFGPGHPPGRP